MVLGDLGKGREQTLPGYYFESNFYLLLSIDARADKSLHFEFILMFIQISLLRSTKSEI